VTEAQWTSVANALLVWVLIGGLWLRFGQPAVADPAALPVAILINAVRVFLTGFLVYR
jgi:hypothetical protein